jgi:DeoR/GlpR family transcriptional regulator of sugar metabolism
MEKENSQMRILRIIQKLAQYPIGGINNQSLAVIFETSEANISRDLSVLKEIGWIHRPEGEGWQLSPVFYGMQEEVTHAYQIAVQKLIEKERDWMLAVVKEAGSYE